MLHANDAVDLKHENKRHMREGQKEDVAKSDRSWDAFEDPDIVHVIDNII